MAFLGRFHVVTLHLPIGLFVALLSGSGLGGGRRGRCRLGLGGRMDALVGVRYVQLQDTLSIQAGSIPSSRAIGRSSRDLGSGDRASDWPRMSAFALPAFLGGRVRISVERERGGDRFRGEILEIEKRAVTRAMGVYHEKSPGRGVLYDKSFAWGADQSRLMR